MEVSERVARELLRAVSRVASRPEECARSPGRDFTRSRRLPLARLLLLLATWGRDSAYAELCELAGWDGAAPSVPALCQQWAKLNDRAMPALLSEFLSGFRPRPYLGRYRLLAADGTEWRLLPGTGGARCRVANGRGGGHHWEIESHRAKRKDAPGKAPQCALWPLVFSSFIPHHQAGPSSSRPRKNMPLTRSHPPPSQQA